MSPVDRPVRAEGDDTPLNRLVRKLILRWPGLFTTRWDVLRHLYLAYGNGFEWIDGELVEVIGEDRSEADCIAGFFSNIDPDDTLAHNRRQFILDNLDLLVHESHWGVGGSIGWMDVAGTSVEYSAAFNVPDDAEKSFRDGAVEVLGRLIPGLHYPEGRGWDDGLRAAAGRERARLAPVEHAAIQGLLAEILADDAARAATPAEETQ